MPVTALPHLPPSGPIEGVVSRMTSTLSGVGVEPVCGALAVASAVSVKLGKPKIPANVDFTVAVSETVTALHPTPAGVGGCESPGWQRLSAGPPGSRQPDTNWCSGRSRARSASTGT